VQEHCAFAFAARQAICERVRYGDADDEHEKREDQVGEPPTVPPRVAEVGIKVKPRNTSSESRRSLAWATGCSVTGAAGLAIVADTDDSFVWAYSNPKGNRATPCGV
jgi:hypothetical protein